MSFKFAIAAPAMVTLLGLFMVGCGSDACATANDHLVECLGVPASSVTGLSPTMKCEAQHACSADCVNAADCGAIKDAFSGMPSDKSHTFLECEANCDMGK